ncbi:MAG: hypothetical protein DRP84_09910, partial [Spirochaetes bacterium]
PAMRTRPGGLGGSSLQSVGTAVELLRGNLVRPGREQPNRDTRRFQVTGLRWDSQQAHPKNMVLVSVPAAFYKKFNYFRQVKIMWR